MPFVKKNDAKDALPRIDVRKLFIGRTHELHFFREEILKPEDPAYNIVSISGQGGVGKSTLLLRFIDDTRATDFKDYCLSALVNERQSTPASIMEKIADQLHMEGDFEKALRQYKEVLHKLQSQHEAAREAFVQKATTDVIGAVVEDVPFVGGLLKEGTQIATSYLFEELHYRQLLKDTERMEDPIGDLTRAFIKELNRLAEIPVTVSSSRVKQPRRVILFFDTFEQLAVMCAPWLLDYFLETEVSNNVILVIAGRDALEDSTPEDPKRWLPYRDNNTIYSISLNSFTEEETHSYLAERGIIDADRIKAIWQLSHGLPLYLGFLTSNPQGKVDPTANVVANFLRWIPEQEKVKRQLALDAALFSRPFNQDELGAFAYISDHERSMLYRWLTAQPFVHGSIEDGRYSYHELAQDMFSRYLYQLSPSEYQATRGALAEYYQRLLKNIETEGDENKDVSAQWLELTLALVYQLFLLPNEAGHTKAVEQILNAYERAEQDGEIIRILRDVSKELSNIQGSSRIQQTIEQIIQYIEIDPEKQEFIQAANNLLGRVIQEPTFSERLIASIYYNRAGAYRSLK